MDEYVRRAYKFAYSECIEVGPLASLPEPPDPNELYPRQSSRQVIKALTYYSFLIVKSSVTVIIASFFGIPILLCISLSIFHWILVSSIFHILISRQK